MHSDSIVRQTQTLDATKLQDFSSFIENSVKIPFENSINMSLARANFR